MAKGLKARTHTRDLSVRRKATRRTSLLMSAVLVALVVPAPTGADARPRPPAERAPQRKEPPAEIAQMVPPQTGPDPTSFSVRAQEIEEALARLVDGADTRTESDRVALSEAQASMAAAAAEWHGGETDVGVAVRHLGSAARAVEPVAAAGDVVGAIGELGQHTAQRVFAVARGSGIDPESQRTLDAIDRDAAAALASGDVGGGIALLGDGLDRVTPKLVFDMDLFRDNVVAFASASVGFAASFWRNGDGAGVRAGGFARVPMDTADGLGLAQSAFRPMNIASVSKVITATAVLRRLGELGISVFTPVSTYLPVHWQKGPGVGTTLGSLNFYDLLTHRSGLDGTGEGLDYWSLKDVVAKGVTQPKTFLYQNHNFALFRVILPHLLDDFTPPKPFCLGQNCPPAQADPAYAAAVTVAYMAYVRDEILARVGPGIDGDCGGKATTEDTLTYAMRTPNPFIHPGVNWGDWTWVCGPGGWHLSATVVGRFASALRNGDLLTQPTRAVMNLLFLGWMDPVNYTWGNGAFGTYLNHGGDLWATNEPGILPGQAQRGVDTCVMSFPNNVQVGLLINSQGLGAPPGSTTASNYLGGPYQCKALETAFDSAWVWTV